MTALLALVLMLLAAGGMPSGPAMAQGNEAASFLDPFPEGDRYRIQVWGDQMAEGLLEGLGEQLVNEPRFQVDKKLRPLAGIMRIDADQEAKSIEASLASGAPHVAVIMLGASDRVAFRRANGRRLGVGSDEWREEYSRRMDLVLRALRKRSVGVLWVGLPVMRREDANTDAEMMNEIFRSRALANGVRYIDIFASFADEDKSFASHGPDLAGKTRLLRDSDGVHFTGAGYRKIAYFVERELKRAATQAWDERTIPLAGSEVEQARIRPAPAVKLAPLNAGARASGAAGEGAPKAAGPGGAGDGPGGIRADNSRITLRSLSEQGREENVTIEIVRPEIPASVVSMLTRRESSDKATIVGDSIMTEILGGLTVVSSVTPLAEVQGERRRGVADQTTPLHRVLQRGESMPPKPGRADEMPWPRPETAVVAAGAEVEPAVATPAAEPAPQKRVRRPPPQPNRSSTPRE